jgi:hypothetical protein
VVAETLEGNNVNFVALSIGPDLVVQSVSGPSGAGAGTTISVNDTTRNQGGGAAGASSTRFYLSANAVLDASDTLLGSRAVPALAAATNSSGSTSLTIPPTTASGSYYLLAQADADGAVLETSEANNTGRDHDPDRTGPGDLLGDRAGRGRRRRHAHSHRHHAQPGRRGGRLDHADPLLDERGARRGRHAARHARGAGAGRRRQQHRHDVGDHPRGTTPGYYYLIAQADGEGALLETIEVNNINYVLILIGPDLVMQSVSGPAASGPG